MRRILAFIQAMAPYMLISVPIFLFVRVLFLKIGKKAGKWNPLHEGALLLFVMFLTGLGSQTVIPIIKFGPGIRILSYSGGGFNLIPFKVLFDTWRETFLKGNTGYFIINFLGNIAMFMPIGFFVPLLWKDVSLKKAVFAGFLISLCIEICQVPLSRGTDIDDLWLNVLGAILGYFAYMGAARLWSALKTAFQVD